MIPMIISVERPLICSRDVTRSHVDVPLSRHLQKLYRWY